MNDSKFKVILLLLCLISFSKLKAQSDYMQYGFDTLRINCITITIPKIYIDSCVHNDYINNENLKLSQSTTSDTLKPKIPKNYTIHGFISLSQAFHKNWIMSDEDVNNIALTTSFEWTYKKKFKRVISKNLFQFDYGYQKITDSILLKNIDRFVIKSQLEIKSSEHSSFKFINNISSQFSPSFNLTASPSGGYNKIMSSSFLSPAYNNLAIGLNFNFWDISSVNIGIASSKITLVNNPKLYQENNVDIIYGVDRNKKWRMEYGWGTQATIYKELIKNVTWEFTLIYFTNGKNPKTADIDISNKFSLKVNKYIKTLINTRLIYDEDISNRLQFQQQLLIGFYF